MHRTNIALILAFALPLALGAQESTAAWPEAKDNLALGKPYTLNKKPNYQSCENPASDMKKLTDGNISKGEEPMWFDKESTVGICGDNVEVTIDLEKSVSIQKVLVHTAAGVSDVTLPKTIKVFASENGKDFSPAGEWKAEAQAPAGYKTHSIVIPVKAANAKYVRVTFIGAYYFFCDDIAVTGN